MDRILIILKKENGPRASSAPALGLNTIIFKHVYWYMQQTQVSVYRTIGPLVANAKTKAQISFAVTAKLISAFVFATRIVKSLFFLNPKFQASSYLLLLYRPVCVRHGRKCRRPVFSQPGSFITGKVTLHKTSGCHDCATTVHCKNQYDTVPCNCHWHTQRRHLDTYKVEINVRRKTCTECASGFPNKEVCRMFFIINIAMP